MEYGFLLLGIALALGFVIYKNAKKVQGSGVLFTDDEALHYRQSLLEKAGINKIDKPKSNLRGVKKRYQKVPNNKKY